MVRKLLLLPMIEDNSCNKKLLDKNNSAYVDGFFTYLTSKLLHIRNFIHGIDFYGTFLGVKKEFEVDIYDDIEFLDESSYFHEILKINIYQYRIISILKYLIFFINRINCNSIDFYFV